MTEQNYTSVNELASIINQLEETYREPFTLLYEGRSYEDIAAVLDISVEEVQKRLTMARRAIRNALSLDYGALAA